MTGEREADSDLFEVLSPGIITTVQDLGRFGYQQYGVPISGGMDGFSLRVANMLADNTEESACLEMTLQGPTLKALRPCYVALTGGNLQPSFNDQRIEMWTAYPMKKDDVLFLGNAVSGCRAYLAVAGGFEVPRLLGSRSTYLRGSFGGYEGRMLRRGDILRGGRAQLRNKVRYLSREDLPQYLEIIKVRVLIGPQNDFFTKNGIETFLRSEYEVTPESDRMGYRLKGPTIEHSGEPEIISDGVAVGAIQVPGSGMPIVAMRDAQTTGGYPKIANVTSVDVDRMAQLKPGDKVRFEQVELEKAHLLVRQHMEYLDNLGKKIRERDLAPEFPDDDTLLRWQGAIT